MRECHQLANVVSCAHSFKCEAVLAADISFVECIAIIITQAPHPAN